MFALLAVSLLLFSVANGATDDPVVVVVGDSWGSYGHEDLQKVLKEKGTNLTVKSYAIGGTTTRYWARKPDLISKLVAENPTAEFVWISIGGNDVIDAMPSCTEKKSVDECIELIRSEAMNNTKKFMDPLVSDHPAINIVMFGYDVPNLDENILCRSIGKEIINGCDGKPECIVPQYAKIQSLYIDALPAMWPNNVEAINLLGSLQAADQYPGVTLGHPDLTKWSPADLMESNCIHPTRVARGKHPAGFKVVFDNMYDVYFKEHGY